MSGRLHPTPKNGRRRVPFVTHVGEGGIDDTVIPELVGAGTIRKLVRVRANSIAGPPPEQWSWVDNPPIITNPLRYRTSTRFRGVGSDATINAGPRAYVRRTRRQSTVTRQAGNRPSAPTVRNRPSSFGSRVPPLNAASTNAEGASAIS